MVDVKPLLEMMTAQHNVYSGERFQLCGMSVGKIIVGRQDLSLSLPSYDRENINKLLRDQELKGCQETA